MPIDPTDYTPLGPEIFIPSLVGVQARSPGLIIAPEYRGDLEEMIDLIEDELVIQLHTHVRCSPEHCCMLPDCPWLEDALDLQYHYPTLWDHIIRD